MEDQPAIFNVPLQAHGDRFHGPRLDALRLVRQADAEPSTVAALLGCGVDVEALAVPQDGNGDGLFWALEDRVAHLPPERDALPIHRQHDIARLDARAFGRFARVDLWNVRMYIGQYADVADFEPALSWYDGRGHRANDPLAGALQRD